MDEYRHFLLANTGSAERYTSTSGGGGEFKTPPRDTAKHGQHLVEQMRQITVAVDTGAAQQPVLKDIHVVPVTFESAQDHELRLESLEDKRQGIRIMNVRELDGKQVATVSIPKGKTDHFVKRFEKYATETTKKGNPKNLNLAASISEIRLALLKDYWTDSGDEGPPQPTETFWWEVWLDRPKDSAVEDDFRAEADRLGMRLSENTVQFPEVMVILAYTSMDGWTQFSGLLNYLAEFRRAKIVPTEFVQLPPRDQAEFIEALRSRASVAPEQAAAVCILDTGVNRNHPLLESSLLDSDAQVWNSAWSREDRVGHGTELAGLALYGPLEDLLLESEPVQLGHRLESVKILPDHTKNDPPDYGPITVGSMAKAELQSPDRPRAFCLAVTADDRDEWRPTLWSAEIDQACSGAAEENRRLLFVSAGNLSTDQLAAYPNSNHLSSVQDPAQSWNAVTVGAYTDKAWIQDPTFKGWSPLAPKGRLSPASTTSLVWDSTEWPIKPDIVLEGGNWARDPAGDVSKVDDLSLLTTSVSFTGALLGMSEDTSAATALASRMGATLLADYPEYWPETIRGLLVHSAEWTPEMIEEFPFGRRRERMRCYGWGVPNLDQARRCARNVATLVIQDTLRPFQKVGSDITTNQMHLHHLPFPKQVLQQFAEEEVSMRVTLSYFIEPSPGRKGWHVKHRYASHGLRFDVKRPEEDITQFRKRLTRDVWDDRQKHPGKGVKDNREWELGSELRTKGCLHSDMWRGTASQLADSELIGVFPVTGWWRERPAQGRYDREARYSLIVTISTKRSDLELYQEVQSAIALQSQVEAKAVEITID